ncbi:endonuclease III [bacterium]|nr:endonuclease III [bacterium]
MSAAQRFDIHRAISLVRTALDARGEHVTAVEARRPDPFKLLITCVLSLRTKDETTDVASARLFKDVKTPRELMTLGAPRIAKLIFPVGFYNVKARQIVKICRQILDDFKGCVPDEIDELLKLPGVGRKTANLVVTEAFRKPGICVDTHVHRITNRWGYVRTKEPNQTETALRKKLPEEYWLGINHLLVVYGKRVCTPLSPKCSECPVSVMCAKRGVTRAR